MVLPIEKGAVQGPITRAVPLPADLHQLTTAYHQYLQSIGYTIGIPIGIPLILSQDSWLLPNLSSQLGKPSFLDDRNLRLKN